MRENFTKSNLIDQSEVGGSKMGFGHCGGGGGGVSVSMGTLCGCHISLKAQVGKQRRCTNVALEIWTRDPENQHETAGALLLCLGRCTTRHPI
jgi:hypothetical protein